jgi:hypothetical protein
MKKLAISLLVFIISLILVVSIGLIITGCVNEDPLTGEQKIYTGIWTAPGDDYIEIWENGKADCEVKNTTISGGTVILEDDSLAIKLMGIKFVSRITAPPKNVDNIWVMELDGITFTKQ